MEAILTNIVAAVNDVLWNKYLVLLFLLLDLLLLLIGFFFVLFQLFLCNDMVVNAPCIHRKISVFIF